MRTIRIRYLETVRAEWVPTYLTACCKQVSRYNILKLYTHMTSSQNWYRYKEDHQNFSPSAEKLDTLM